MSTPRALSRGICALLPLPLAFTLSACGLKLSDGPNGVTLEMEGPESAALSTNADTTEIAISENGPKIQERTLTAPDSTGKIGDHSPPSDNAPKDAPNTSHTDQSGFPMDAQWYGNLTPEDFTDTVTIIGGIATINDSDVKVHISEPIDLLLIQGQNVKVVADEVGGLVINGQDVDVIAKSYGLVTLNGMNSNVVWTNSDDPQVINAGTNNTSRGAR